MRPEVLRKAFARGRRLAKRPPDVQQTAGGFPNPSAEPRHGKSRRIPAAFSMIWGAGSARSEPLAAAVAVPIRAAIVAVHAALEPAVPPAFCAKLAAVMGQQRKPALLAVVE